MLLINILLSFLLSSGDSVPMISLGLKETKDANFKTVFMVSGCGRYAIGV